MSNGSANAKAGVDYSVMEPFKQAMIAAGSRTLSFPNKRGVYINQDVMHAHGGVYEYRGDASHMWCNTQEGLGNKNWIAEWMYQNEGTGKTYYDAIAKDVVLMAANDVIAQGAMPVVFTDEVAVGDASWFADKKRADDLGRGFYEICQEIGAALPAGESPALKYLMKPEAPVKAAPSLSGCVTGIIAPKENLITGKDLAPGDHIIGAPSSGLHANGISVVIHKALELPDQFLTKLPNGHTLGAEALIPTRSYVALVESLLTAGIKPRAILPGTGDGVGKLAYDKRPFTYRVHTWGEVPPLFQYFREQIGLPLYDCLKTFNWGMGYYLFVGPDQVEETLRIGKEAGYNLLDLGVVEDGKREVIFEPEGITLPPPGE
ncbi:MAG: AIR synthase related protein [Patescibacteria group bacterium]